MAHDTVVMAKSSARIGVRYGFPDPASSSSKSRHSDPQSERDDNIPKFETLGGLLYTPSADFISPNPRIVIVGRRSAIVLMVVALTL